MNKVISTTIALLFALQLSAQVLVIPDIHGRTYWKEATAKHPDVPVIFLGDYLDPYSYEGISPEDALTNFKDILAFKKANMDRVTLLIGNHEVHYIDTALWFSRKDTVNAEYIHQLLHENLPLFLMATHVELDGKSYLFTHSGILEAWWKKYFPETPTDAASICNALNSKMKDSATFVEFIDDALMNISKLRRGDAEAGSCVWADVREQPKKTDFLKETYQVFGHTQLRKKPVIKNSFADLDCRKAFLLTTKDGQTRIVEFGKE
ncbi:MAG: metallophosphoesterase [Salinivirgaceae bacterium]|nr:metallophosphoesterase [Salinivirgaceae bacterium]